MNEKKPSCPNCNSEKVSWIFYGYPGDIDWYLKAIENKEIVGGGCIVTDHDPKWECIDCLHRWGDAEHNDEDKIDSFDYDKGFNLEQVYDQ